MTYTAFQGVGGYLDTPQSSKASWGIVDSVSKCVHFLTSVVDFITPTTPVGEDAKPWMDMGELLVGVGSPSPLP